MNWQINNYKTRKKTFNVWHPLFIMTIYKNFKIISIVFYENDHGMNIYLQKFQ